MSYNNNFFDTCNFLIFTRENEPRWLFSLTIFRKYFIHCRDTFLKFASILSNPQKYCIAWLIRFLIFQNILHIDIVYQIHRIITRKFLGKNLRLSDFRVACAIATSARSASGWEEGVRGAAYLALFLGYEAIPWGRRKKHSSGRRRTWPSSTKSRGQSAWLAPRYRPVSASFRHF